MANRRLYSAIALSPSFRRLGKSELLPRYIFAENLFVRRRVLEVGAVASTSGESALFLAQRGARFVLSCDDDLKAVETAQAKLPPNSSQVRYRANVFDDLEPGSFDLIVVADLAAYVRAPLLLQELAGLLAKPGYLLGGLRNPAGFSLSQIQDPEEGDPPPTWGQLLDALSAHFPSVEVATQAPVLGYQLAFEKSEGLSVDGSLCSGSEAAYFVALAGQAPLKNQEPTWVQLPPEPLAFSSDRLSGYAERTRTWEDRSRKFKESLIATRGELEESKAKADALSVALETAREEAARLSAQLETARAARGDTRNSDELTAKIRRLEADFQLAEERTADAEARNTKARAQTDAAEAARQQAELSSLTSQEDARKERARREEVFSLLEEAREKLSSRTRALKEAEEKVAEAEAEVERARLSGTRTQEVAREHAFELDSARRREVALAGQVSSLQSSLEVLKQELTAAQTALLNLEGTAADKEARYEQALRAAEADQRAKEEAQKAQAQVVEDYRAKVEALEATQARLEEDHHGRLSELVQIEAEAEAAHRAKLEEVEQRARLAESEHAAALADEVAKLKAEAAVLTETHQQALDDARQEEGKVAAGLRLELEAFQLEQEKRAEAHQLELEELRQAQAGIEAEHRRQLEEIEQQHARIAEVHRLQLEARQQELAKLSEAHQLDIEKLRAEQGDVGEAHRLEIEQLHREQTGSEEAHRLELEAQEVLRRQWNEKVSALVDRELALLREVASLKETLAGGDVALAEVQSRIREASSDREALLEKNADLQGALDDIRRAHTEGAEAYRLLAEERAREVRVAEEERQKLQLEIEEVKRRAAQEVSEFADALEQRSQTLADLEMALQQGKEALVQAQTEAGDTEAEHSQALGALQTQLHNMEKERQLSADAHQQEMESLRAGLGELDQLRAALADVDAVKKALADKESRTSLLERRLAAQDRELAALRKMSGKLNANPVQQIYERANAELSAVKAELARTVPVLTPAPEKAAGDEESPPIPENEPTE